MQVNCHRPTAQPEQPGRTRPTMATTAAPVITVHLTPEEMSSALAADVRHAFTRRPKQLSPKWLYDPAGCVLFDRITELD